MYVWKRERKRVRDGEGTRVRESESEDSGRRYGLVALGAAVRWW